MSEGALAPYTVDFVNQREQAARLERWAAEATARGLLRDLLDVLQHVLDRLRLEPSTWGDPLFEARHAEFLMYHRVYRFFHVSYAVHEKSRTVWIKDLRPLPGHGFSEVP
jgi:hypothetical protein